MKIKPAASASLSFRHLNVQEIQDPTLVIDEFFQLHLLESFRQDLRNWFKTGTAKRRHPKSRLQAHIAPAGLHKQVIKLVEAAFIWLYDESIDFKLKEKNLLFQPDEDGYKPINVDLRLQHSMMKHCRVLSAKEINNVKKVFKAIFKYLSLEQWRNNLDILLEYSQNEPDDSKPCSIVELLFPMYESLEKLVETTLVIRQLKDPSGIQHTLNIKAKHQNTDNIDFRSNPYAEDYEHECLAAKAPENKDEIDPYDFDIRLSLKLQKEIVRYFELFNPKLVHVNLRKILFGYLSNMIQNAMPPFDEDDESNSQMAQLFNLVDSIEEEVSHWPRRLDVVDYNTIGHLH